VEFALLFVLGLPDNAIAPGSQGQLGFGATYFAANGPSTNAAMFFPKQVFIRFNELGSVTGNPSNLVSRSSLGSRRLRLRIGR